MHEYIISLGSNQGDRLTLLASALEKLTDAGCMVDATSRIIETAPWGFTDQADFLNQAVQVRGVFDPRAMLSLCQKIEKELGRERDIKWGPRTLDMDIIAWNGGVYDRGGLEIPHPRMHQRLFVLLPMEEIQPDWVHPIRLQTIEELIEQLQQNENKQ